MYLIYLNIPDTYVCVSGGKKCLFFGNFGVLCFLETPVLRFALLPYYRRTSLQTTQCKGSVIYVYQTFDHPSFENTRLFL